MSRRDRSIPPSEAGVVLRRRWGAISRLHLLAVALVGICGAGPVLAQAPHGGPPAVGVAKVTKQPMTQSNAFQGRIQAIQRVDVVARVSAFVEEVVFKEGTEVKKGDVLYRLERGPFEADLAAKKAAVEQTQAQLQNSAIQLERARELARRQFGSQETLDTAIATQKANEALLLANKANVQASEINLGYTTIASPIDGKASRTAITLGNVVSPGSGVLTTIVSQDPIYVTFPVSVRTLEELRKLHPDLGSEVLIHVLRPDGSRYPQAGKLNFLDNTVQGGTDTLILRGTIPNPPMSGQTSNNGVVRGLIDNQFVTVLLEGAEPVETLVIPRSAVLSDQRGNYVWLVGPDNVARRQDIVLGQSTPTVAAVTSGLKEGDTIVVGRVSRSSWRLSLRSPASWR